MTGSAGPPLATVSCLGCSCSCQLGHGPTHWNQIHFCYGDLGQAYLTTLHWPAAPRDSLWPWGERPPLGTPLPLSSLHSPVPSTPHTIGYKRPFPCGHSFLNLCPSVSSESHLPHCSVTWPPGGDPRACLYPQGQGNPEGPRVVPEGRPASQRTGPVLTSLQVSVRGAGRLSVLSDLPAGSGAQGQMLSQQPGFPCPALQSLGVD